MEMTAASIALNRFGLGYRNGDAQPGDPRDWLRDQIGRFDPLPSALAGRGNDRDNIDAVMAEFERAGRMVRRAGEDDATAEVAQVERKSVGREQRLAYHSDAGLRARVAAESDTPFMERIVHFWSNHFAVGAGNARILSLAGVHEFGAIRPNVTRSFRDLVVASALHPTMLLYLDQHRSIGPNSAMSERRGARNPGGAAGLNENLAREILELHTLGVGGGYSQADVTEFAKSLTGWTVGGLRLRIRGKATGTGAIFIDGLHEPGTRRILGREYVEAGEDQVRAVIDDLVAHPSTAKFIATKLARHFSGDTPPPAMVARLEKAFQRSRGDLSTVYEAIIASPEAWVEQPVKFRQPWEWFVGMLRAGGTNLVPERRVSKVLEELGQAVWKPNSPAGYDDRAASWLAPDALFRRASLAEQVARKAQLSDVRRLAEAMFPGSLSATTMSAIRAAESNTMALTLLLVSPEMLRR